MIRMNRMTTRQKYDDYLSFNTTKNKVRRLDQKLNAVNRQSYNQYNRSDALRAALTIIEDMDTDRLRELMKEVK